MRPQRARALALAFAMCAAAPILAQERPSATSALSYSEAQRAAGQRTYGAQCANCHGFNLQGAAGPALSGVGFQKTWMNGTRSVRSLFDLVKTTMPTNHPGSLTPEQVFQLLAYTFSNNGLAPGSRPLGTASLASLIPLGSQAAVAAAPHHALKLPAAPTQVGRATTTVPTDEELLSVPAGDWLHYNRNYAGDRFSPLAEINAGNAAQLQVRCIAQLGEMGSFEPSPIAYRGMLYLTTPHRTFAVDGQTCAIRWSHTYTPVDPQHIPGDRGVALYRGKLYRGTTDGYLLCFDAATGKLLWTAHVDDGYNGAFVSGAPLAFDGKIFVGEGGADSGIHGRFFAFDAETGRPLWTFDIIPPPGNPARKTWGSFPDPRGGSSWSSVALDVKRRLLFVPTGNPGPDFDGSERPGDNLYTDSVVALHADTGKLAWYVQQVPHDVHDWDTAAAPTIYERGDKRYLAVASKNGLLYVYDRDSKRTVAATPTTTRRNVDAPFAASAPVTYCPGGLGQWNGPAYAAQWNRLFVGAADRCDTIVGLARPAPYTTGQMDFGAQITTDRTAPTSGWVRAIDAENGKEAWSYHAPYPIVAAVTPTAGGLVLTGDIGGDLLVLDAHTGQRRYRFMTGGGIAGGVTPYEAGGHELLAVPSGNSSQGTWGSTGSATLIVFGLPSP